MTGEPMNVTGHKVTGFQTSQGFGSPAGADVNPEPMVGMHLFVDLPAEGGELVRSQVDFVLRPGEAVILGRALVESGEEVQSRG